MQLGSRWSAGQAPHSAVPALLHAVIASAEESHPSGSSWTLTWLEGRPRVELLSEAGTVLVDLGVDSSGEVTALAALGERAADEENRADCVEDDDDDWLG